MERTSELHQAMQTATFAIQDYMKPYQNTDNYITHLKSVLSGVVSSTVEIAEVQHDGISQYLWAELEEMAKAGGLTAVGDKIRQNRSYSISEIAPDDVASGMNYLGQHLGTTLFKRKRNMWRP